MTTADNPTPGTDSTMCVSLGHEDVPATVIGVWDDGEGHRQVGVTYCDECAGQDVFTTTERLVAPSPVTPEPRAETTVHASPDASAELLDALGHLGRAAVGITQPRPPYCGQCEWDGTRLLARCALCASEPPAEVDDQTAEGYDEFDGPLAHRDAAGVLWVPVEVDRGYAARPSADTETLRRVQEVAAQLRREADPLGGPAARAYAVAADQLDAALGGPQ